MPRKPGWPPVLPKQEQLRREKFRQKLEADFSNTVLRVCKAEKEKRLLKFSKPYWPPVISSEESERRRLFRESLDGSTPSKSKQWPPQMRRLKVSGKIFKLYINVKE